MDETFIYQQTAESVRLDIIQGISKPGDRLPSVREMTARWHCTPGTVQRAYQELVRQGLIVSRPGQGTRVAGNAPVIDDTPLRRATLVHRAEAFLLESLGAGFQPEEVEQAVQQAMERWRINQQTTTPFNSHTLRFSGSHDLAVAWLAAHWDEIHPGSSLALNFSGSLGGLIALQRGEADLAGAHLWDEESDQYNLPFIQRVLPGREVVCLTLAHRRIGLIVPQENPLGLQQLADLAQPGVRFANRQSGSGTRVWLDAMLHRLAIPAQQIDGYLDEKNTHTEVARAVAEAQASVGLGLEAAAHAYRLDFIPLTSECYQLITPAENFDRPIFHSLTEWLASSAARQMLTELGGYDTTQTGRIEWIK